MQYPTASEAAFNEHWANLMKAELAANFCPPGSSSLVASSAAASSDKMSLAAAPDGLHTRSPEPIWQLVQFKKMQAFNDANEANQRSLQCWPVIELPSDQDAAFRVWIMVVLLDVHAEFPMAKDMCRLRVEGQAWWEASRVPNPTAKISTPDRETCKYSTYKVKVPRSVNNDKQPLFAPLEMTKDPEDGALRPIFCEQQMLWASLRLEIQSTPQLNDQIASKAVPDAAWKFHDPRHYNDIFRWGTEEDFEFEAAGIRSFNRQSVYKCWLVVRDTSDRALPRPGSKGIKRQQCVVVIAVPEVLPEEFPRVGDLCDIAFKGRIPTLDKLGNTTKENEKLKRDGVKYLGGARLDNPYDKLGLNEESGAGSSWNNYCTFKVTVYKEFATDYSPLDDFVSKLDWSAISRGDSRQKPRITLDQASAFEAHLWLRISTTTRDSELNALREAMEQPVDSRIGKAFSYIRTFESSTETFNLLQALPHMDSDSKLPDNMSPLFQRLDDDQKYAYRRILSNLPARVGILPAGPGTRKSQLFLTISALALSSTEETQMNGGPILLILEANRPANAAASRVMQHFEQLNRRDLRILRAYNFNYESVWGARRYLKREGSDDSHFDEMFETHRPDHVPQLRRGRKDECLAPNLKEAAQQYLADHLEDFPAMSKLLRVEDPKEIRADDAFDEIVRGEWDALFRSVLSATDYVVTTPVGAWKIAPYFRPKLVLFDESSRARELGSLVAIANFPSAEAFLFSGTVEMTKPYLASHGSHLWSPCSEQLRTSMMARFLGAVPDAFRLSLNHQAYGNLHCLSSELFWDGGISSALPSQERYPPSTMHLLHYCRDLSGNQTLTVPRLLVHVTGSSPADFRQRSKSNKRHLNWVVNKIIRDFVQDPDFRSTDGNEPGSIIITTPYRAQFTLYRKAVNNLMRELDRDHHRLGSHSERLHRQVQVQPATADVVQGHAADLVIVDLVNWAVTPHVADPNRLCAALTRAKQCELIIMERSMTWDQEATGRRSFGYVGPHIMLLHEHCESMGQVVVVDPVDDGQAKRVYSLHRADPPSGIDASEVPRQLPVLHPSLNLPQEDEKAETSPAAAESKPPALEGEDDDGDVEEMFGIGGKFGFEMVRKAMKLGLNLPGGADGSQ